MSNSWATHRANRRAQWLSFRVAFAVVTGFVCVLLVTRLEWSLVAALLDSTNHELLALALATNLGYFLIRGIRWWLLVGGVERSLSVLQAMQISNLGVLTSSVFPGLGEATRLFYLRRHALPTSGAAAVVLQERLSDTFTLGALLIVSLAGDQLRLHDGFLASARLPLIALGVVVVAAVLAGTLSWRRRGLGSPRSAGSRTVSIAETIGRFVAELTESSLRLIRQPLRCFGVVVATGAVHLLAVATAWLTLRSFGLEVPPLAVVGLVALLNLGLGLVPSPMGIGLYQMAGLVTLNRYAATLEVAVAAATVLQAINYSAAILAAAPSIVPALWSTGKGKSS